MITTMIVVPIILFTLGIWIVASQSEDRPTKKRCRHDWDMDFPNNDLNWLFTCKKCGRTTTRMEDTY